jgi:hypothetical protein
MLAVESILHALSQLGSFNHDQCDAVLSARQVIIPGVFSAGNQPPFRNTLYLDPGLVLYFSISSVVLLGVLITRVRREAPRTTLIVIALTFFACLFLVTLSSYVIEIARYSSICRDILGLS